MTTMRKAETRVFPSIKIWLLIAVLVICGTASFASCSSNEDNSTEQSNITNIADKVWAFSQSHPDGFTIDIRTMTEPTEGIAVSYAATLNSHSRDQLDKVVSHALQHEGYVGGWYNSEDGLYYFDSTKLFPESDLKGAVQFGKENGQYSVFILSTYTDIPLDGKVAEIIERGTILFGTTGDYRPLSFREADGTYWGFGIEVANEIAARLGVSIAFVPTSWPTLTADVLAEPQTFDLAIGGITITDTRRETMLMSEGYLANGKTILCRGAGRCDDNRDNGGTLLRTDRCPTCRTVVKQTIYPRRDWCAHAKGTGGLATDGE